MLRSEHTFAPYALPQIVCILSLSWLAEIIVYMNIETSTHSVTDGIREALIGCAFDTCLWIHKALAIGVPITARDSCQQATISHRFYKDWYLGRGGRSE